MFVQSRKFLEAHGGNNQDLSVFGQESNAETWRLAKMNLALHGIDGDLSDRAESSFTADLHPDLRADFIITNPPFNLGEKGQNGWGRDQLLEDALENQRGVTAALCQQCQLRLDTALPLPPRTRWLRRLCSCQRSLV